MTFAKKTIQASFLLAALGAAGHALAANTNLVTNGNFDDMLQGWTEYAVNTHSGANYQGRYKDNPSPVGGNNFGVQFFNGAYNTNNSGDLVPDGVGIYQNISGLVIGHTYELTFYQTGSDFRWAGEQDYWQVTFGSETKDGARWKVEPGNDNYLWNGNWNRTDATGDSINANFRWTKSVLTFVASATTQRLGFKVKEDADVKSNWDTSVTAYGTPPVMLLDGIKLNDVTPVPEASSGAMLLAGIGTLGLVVTRRRQLRKADKA
jgi:hypothetical protein